MIYLLDTNPCVRFLNGRALGVMRRLPDISNRDVPVSTVIESSGRIHQRNSTCQAVSYRPGPHHYDMSHHAHRREDELSSLFTCYPLNSLPFDDVAAQVYGRIRAELAAVGALIGANDLMIAAVAIANDLILVTHNMREFQRVHGLRLEDWEAT